MAAIKLEKGKIYGAVGYPMLMSISSGIELLGGLLSEKNFSTRDDDEYFNVYWDSCLTAYKSLYTKEICNVIRNLVRHGIAHTFLAKPDIYIKKGDPSVHFKYDRNGFWIDPVLFFEDFRRSYQEKFKPLINPETVQKRLNEMLQKYGLSSSALLSKIKKDMADLKTDLTASSTVTGNTGGFTGPAQSNTTSYFSGGMTSTPKG